MISGTATDGAIINGVIINGIILAENDALMRGIIRAVLLRAEQQVFPVGNGAEAVALAQQFRARLVLLDIAMPRLNGLLACEAIRALPDYAEVPIVMLTGHDDERFRVAARRVGATDFLVKPFQPNALLARLASYLDRPQRAQPAAAPAGADIPPGVIWKPNEMPGPELDEHSQLITGREVLRIQRDAERSC
jgi:DNA-binding response OmpR family regulator